MKEVTETIWNIKSRRIYDDQTKYHHHHHHQSGNQKKEEEIERKKKPEKLYFSRSVTDRLVFFSLLENIDIPLDCHPPSLFDETNSFTANCYRWYTPIHTHIRHTQFAFSF